MVARAVLSRMVESDGGFEIAAVAGTAEDAIDALQPVRVDVILLDLEMPGAGGLKSIPRILDSGARRAGDDRLLAGRGRRRGNRRRAGAGRRRHLAQARHRPLQRPLLGNPAAQAEGARPCRATAAARRPRRCAQRLAARRCAPCRPIRSTLLAIGASTGGIHALGSFFQALPAKIGVPILVTQHLPAPFMTVFARQLGDRRQARGAGRRGRHGAAARPDHHRAGRRAPHGRRVRRPAGRPARPQAARRAAACRRSIRCSRRPAPCSAPRRWASC